MARSLKDANRVPLLAMMAANMVVFYAAVKADAIFGGDWLELARGWQDALPAGVGLILVGIANAQTSAENKARIVFLRWKNPLPGSEAFTRHAAGDPRVNLDAIEVAHGLGKKEIERLTSLLYDHLAQMARAQRALRESGPDAAVRELGLTRKQGQRYESRALAELYRAMTSGEKLGDVNIPYILNEKIALEVCWEARFELWRDVATVRARGEHYEISESDLDRFRKRPFIVDVVKLPHSIPLNPDEAVQTLAQGSLIHRRDTGQQAIAELAADDRADLGHFLDRIEPVQPGLERVLQGGGNRELAEIAQ